MTDITANVVSVSILFELLYKAEEEGKEYPVDFEFLWQWCGYSRKDNALVVLKKELTEGQDFQVILRTQGNLKGGRPLSEYWLTSEGAKHFSLLARTPQGKEVRAYLIEAERDCRKLVQALHETRALASDAINSFDSFVTLVIDAINLEEHVPDYLKRAAIDAKAKVLEYKLREKQLRDSYTTDESKWLVSTGVYELQAMASNEVHKLIAKEEREFTRVNKRKPQPKKAPTKYYNSMGEVLVDFNDKPCSWDYLLKYYDRAYDLEGNQVYPLTTTKVRLSTSDDSEF